mmetsp:Transcript_17025/g.14966  ORF Transcript_17025/g.14966 Transcript_17025/m.14966 type:complete len:178 (+) Transcript_17025:45-578(+)
MNKFDYAFTNVPTPESQNIKPQVVLPENVNFMARQSRSSCGNRKNLSKIGKNKASSTKSGRTNPFDRPNSRNSSALNKFSHDFNPKMSNIKTNIISFRYCNSKDSLMLRKGNNSQDTKKVIYKAIHGFKQSKATSNVKESKISNKEVDLSFNTLSYDYNEFVQGNSTEMNSANNKSF